MKFSLRTLLIALGFVMVAGALLSQTCCECWLGHHHHHASERPPGPSIKTLASAQADFRANDRDLDGRHAFWRGDVAGLYAIRGEGKEMIKLIEVSVALADDRPIVDVSPLGPRRPKAGYLYRALRHADEKEPSPDRFAVCSYPADYPAPSRKTFILSEENVVYVKDLGRPGPPDVFPVDPLKEGWKKLE